jgi:ABC-type phosphate transport system substrate-binding protein
MRALPLVYTTLVLAFSALAATVSAKEAPPEAAPPAYRIIVHPTNPANTVSKILLQDAFLKKTTRWPDDRNIRPADLKASSPVRVRFTEEVLGRTVAAVRSYWQQRIFSGRGVPPPELDSDQKVVAYVLEHEGAVGYVSGTANLQGAKTVALGK